MKEIVVPIDGSSLSERAISVGAGLARAAGCPLTLMTVTAIADTGEWTEYLRAKAGLVTDLKPQLSVVHSDIGVTEVLIGAAERVGAVLCMSSHGRSGVGQALLGSVAEGVVRQAERPVLVVGPSCSRDVIPSGPMLVCLDGSHQAEKILPVALSWADDFSVKMRLIQVVSRDYQRESHEKGLASDTYEFGYIEQAVHQLDRHSHSIDWDVLHGEDPADSIVSEAQGSGASLVAMTSHSRRGRRRITLGSVAMKVVHNSPCPVLLLHPRSS